MVAFLGMSRESVTEHGDLTPTMSLKKTTPPPSVPFGSPESLSVLGTHGHLHHFLMHGDRPSLVQATAALGHEHNGASGDTSHSSPPQRSLTVLLRHSLSLGGDDADTLFRDELRRSLSLSPYIMIYNTDRLHVYLYLCSNHI